MTSAKLLEFLAVDMWAYLLAAAAAAVVGTLVWHWAFGLVLAIITVVGMRKLTPLFKRLLGGEDRS